MVTEVTIGLRTTKMIGDSMGTEWGSLSAAREFITGCKHQSSTCIGTQTSKAYVVDHNNLLLMTTMALAMICNTLMEASFAISSSGIPKTKLYNQKVVREAYAFIQGTSLDIKIMEYHLDLDPERIRNEFFRIFHA